MGFDYEPELLMTVAGIASVGTQSFDLPKAEGWQGLATAFPILLFIEPALVGVWIATFLITRGGDPADGGRADNGDGGSRRGGRSGVPGYYDSGGGS